MKGEIRQDATRTAYENNWMRVREDQVTFPNGHKSIFGVVEKPDSVVVLPYDADGRIHLVSQYRYAIGMRTWELPQGAWPHRPDAKPEEVAAGELKEETGFVADKMEPIGELFQSPGLSRQRFGVFLATGLTPGSRQLEVTESDLETQAFSMKEIRAMIADGRLMDSTTLAVFGLLAMHGRLPSFDPGAL